MSRIRSRSSLKVCKFEQTDNHYVAKFTEMIYYTFLLPAVYIKAFSFESLAVHLSVFGVKLGYCWPSRGDFSDFSFRHGGLSYNLAMLKF